MESKYELSVVLQGYLEKIYEQCVKNKVARVSEIARIMNVHKTSVTSALKELSKRNLIHYSPYQYITLTKEGEKQAKKLMQKHKIIQDFFEQILLIPSEIAERNACIIEHVVEDAVLERFEKFLQFQRLHCDTHLIWNSDKGFICPKA